MYISRPLDGKYFNIYTQEWQSDKIWINSEHSYLISDSSSDAELASIRLSYAKLEQANLRKAELEQANLDNHNLINYKLYTEREGGNISDTEYVNGWLLNGYLFNRLCAMHPCSYLEGTTLPESYTP